MSTSDIRDRLTQVLSVPLAALGLDLEEVHLSKAGKRSVLRIAVDRDGGVDMDAVADATRAVSTALDESDAMGEQPYTLEVGSPGVDRLLTLPRHWRRNEGRLVALTLTDGTKVTGRITASDETGVVVSDDSADAGSTRLSYADVAKARIQIEFKKGS